MKNNFIYLLLLTVLVGNTFAIDRQVQIIGDGGSTGTRLFFFDQNCNQNGEAYSQKGLPLFANLLDSDTKKA